MDPAQRLTQKLLRFWRAARSQRPAPGPHAARLDDLRTRLTLFAALLAGEPLEIVAAEEGPAALGATVLLPPSIDVYAERERNVEAYLYRIAFTVCARRLGFALDASGLDLEHRRLALLLAVPLIDVALEREYPALAAMRARLAPELCARRTDDPKDTSVRSMLEALACERLSPGASRAEHASPPELRAWWRAACDLRVADPPQLREATLRSYGALRACTGRVGSRPLHEVVIWGELPAPGGNSPVAPLDPGQAPRARRNETRRAIELRRALQVRRAAPRPREDRPLFHAFEKIDTAEDYRGEGATPDAEEHVERMEDALQDLSLATVIRTEDEPGQLARADVLLDPAQFDASTRAADGAGPVYRYPEWDHRDRRYLPDHCTVLARRVAPADPAEPALLAARAILTRHRRQIDEVRMHLLRGLFRRTVRSRQPEGPEIDVEAMVERHADLRAGRSPPERLFLAGRKTPRDIAVLVLLDASFSTDAWIEGRRVLDVEIESLLVLAAAFEGYLEHEICVAAFHSRTRNEVHFEVLKDFGDTWSRLRLLAAGITPQGYTRIGAAIRHATVLLAAEHATHRLLLLVSDGKPTDLDRYEGRYGFEDVAMAVREAASRDVRTFGLAIEKEAKFHLARMLGRGAYRILPRTELLPQAMADVFMRLWMG